MLTSAGHHATHALKHSSLSPPDADSDSSHPLGADLDMAQASTGYYPGVTKFQPRRTSTLSYQNSGNRDPRDRSSSRGPKTLVVLIPPPGFSFDQHHLGHVLSMGPRHRLSQGLLMPLFPSMFGQLNAIAREYNFPSTAGLCLYLHMNENGITMTPRISDESWQYLFGHLFEARQPVGGQLPVGGSIEFDIDLNKARWFDAWASGASRDPEPGFPPVFASRPSLLAHRRERSQNSIIDGQPIEDRLDDSGSQTLLANSRPEMLRHVPRKLSLVDRLETNSIQTPPKLQNPPDRLGWPPTKHEIHKLSPIPQSAIPPAVEGDLERRVNSWRAATELFPVSMGEAYQPVPDNSTPVGVMNMDDYTMERYSREAVNMDEFHWSISSMGPRSPVMESPVAFSRSPSIHLDQRANGSVPPTPTTATSWGPVDDDWFSVISSTSRLPSPDIGERLVEDVMVPRHSGVWGCSFGWRSATTWIQVYPYSIRQTKPTIRVQLQDSDGFIAHYPNLIIYPAIGSHSNIDYLPNPPKPQSSSRSIWGSSFGWKTATTWGKVYPYSTVIEHPIDPIQFPGAGGLVSAYPNLTVYPAVYPYSDIYPACTIEGNAPQPVSVVLDESNNAISQYPSLVIYPSMYPHFDIYPPTAECAKTDESTRKNIDICSMSDMSMSYPKLVIYPAIYPHFDLYPKALQITKTLKQKEAMVKLANGRTDYPHFDIYPPRATVVEFQKPYSTGKVQSIVNLICQYPNLVIYPAVYPHLDVYPADARAWDTVACGKGQLNLRRRRIEMWRAKTAAQVGLVDLLANGHVWEVDEPLRLDLDDYAWSLTSAGPGTSLLELPHIQSISGSLHIGHRVRGSAVLTPSPVTTWGPQDDDWFSDVISINRLPSPDLGQRLLDDAENPDFLLQRSWCMVWPFFGATQAKIPSSVPEKPASASEYPLVIYPPVYPHFELYPAWQDASTMKVADSNNYPTLDIYPAVYPHFNIYPTSLQVETTPKVASNVPHEQVKMKLPTIYPNFDIYPPCYPYNLEHIHPFTNAMDLSEIPAKGFCSYPWLVIYPPAYPYIIPYPGFSSEIAQPLQRPSPVFPLAERKPLRVALPMRYPMSKPYPTARPWFLESIYATISADDRSGLVRPQYPRILLYPPVYPFVQPYPTDSVHVPGTIDEAKYEFAEALLALSNVTNRSLIGYPHFDLYPPAAYRKRTMQTVGTGDLVAAKLQKNVVTRRQRKTHMDLHASVFRRLDQRSTAHSKMHLQLHAEVFQNGIVWTPSGYAQDLDLTSVQESPHRAPQARCSVTPRSSGLRSGTTTAQSPDKIGFPLGSSALLPVAPVSVRYSGSLQPTPAVSEVAMPRVSSPPQVYTHVRSTSSRLSQAVKCMMPGAPRRNSTGAAPESPSAEDPRERAKDVQLSPTKRLSLVDRRPSSVPRSHANVSEFPVRASPRKDSLVLQRARAYEQSTTAHRSSRTLGIKGILHSPFALSSFPATATASSGDDQKNSI